MGARQRTCGAEKCRREQKRRKQELWSARNPSYWTERRLREQAEKIEALSDGELDEAGASRGAPQELAELPQALCRRVLGSEGLVILLFLARVLARSSRARIGRGKHGEGAVKLVFGENLAQAANALQVAENKGESAR